MSTPAERKALSRKRRAGTLGSEPASQRIQGALCETRTTPQKSGNTYEHELTPAGGAPLDPHAKQRLQQRRSSRISAVREKSAREKLAAGKETPAFAQERHLVPRAKRKRDGWDVGELFFLEGKFGSVTEHLGGRYLKVQLHDGSLVADCFADGPLTYYAIDSGRADDYAECFSAEALADGWLDASAVYMFDAYESNSPPPLISPLRLVKEKIVEDRCAPAIIAPSSKFTQVWRLRNLSFSRTIENCRLVHVDGLAGVLVGGAKLLTIAPRALIEVAVEFEAPAASGECAESRWQFESADGFP